MPEMDGLTFIRELRRSHRREDLPVIGLSAREGYEVSAQLLKVGVNDFLKSPFSLEEFNARLKQNLELTALIRDIRDQLKRDYLTGVYNRRSLHELGTNL